MSRSLSLDQAVAVAVQSQASIAKVMAGEIALVGHGCKLSFRRRERTFYLMGYAPDGHDVRATLAKAVPLL